MYVKDIIISVDEGMIWSHVKWPVITIHYENWLELIQDLRDEIVA